MSGYHLLDENFVDPKVGKATPGKTGMWIFLATDGMSFSGFLLAYAVLRATKTWPSPLDHLGIDLSGLATFILVCSSVSMVFAIDACKQKNKNGQQKWLLATILGGIFFLGIQAYEYTHLAHQGLTLTNFVKGNNLFGSTFYMITGFHGLHVLSGVIYLITMFFRGRRGDFDNGHYSELEVCGLFWHFVDLVWILVFSFVYLI
jgi:heme/copper-type cytochrome/quinol oxidase subunit 3